MVLEDLIISHIRPSYSSGHLQVHEELSKVPPFKQISMPHLHIVWLHINGQYVATLPSEQDFDPKTLQVELDSLLQFPNSQRSP